MSFESETTFSPDKDIRITDQLCSCLYYWGQCGVLMGLTLYRPANSAKALEGTIYDSLTYLGFWTIFIFVGPSSFRKFCIQGHQISEVLNLYSHIHLRSLRTPVGEPRKYPTGFGFGTTVCANYFYESLGLIGLLAITGGDLGGESGRTLLDLAD